MHGCEISSISSSSSRRRRFRRMLSVDSSVEKRGVIAAVGDSGGGGGLASLGGSSVKDIHKINIGDCGLFEPPQDSPPFIGIIRSLGSDKEKNLQLGVTWLYRPADVHVLKGIAVEAAPNEVFYSFHRDEIPAASLLHPCKVAFLAKGAELPSGISSFVCRRVYDSANKHLWWLTEKSFINGRQEEVDQLLHKTQIEMHATVQQQHSGRSPKPVNSPRSTSQLKHSPDSVQNSNVFSTKSKGKKRERSDQGSEPVKREHLLKPDDGESNIRRPEVMLKSEIAKITEKGGLVDSKAVERLVQLMQPDKSDRKIDITCRSLLAGVIAATDKVDCLNQFVQLRGLPVLDKWLQEVHKGKVYDSGSPRDHDKSVEEFLLSLLCALDRLPVNLNALQMCNIGKSVNHLRSHRNSDIQRKARFLVDTWKKRVEAEMSVNDSRSTGQGAPWVAKTRHEISHGGSKHSSTSDAVMKNLPSQLSSSKSAPAKAFQEDVAKSVSASAAVVKLPSSPASINVNIRDGHHKAFAICGSSELPLSAVKDEKSSSSSQSHSNSHCSSDLVKNMGSSVKEDARSSNSGSRSLNKSSGSASRHRKGANGLKGVAAFSVKREGGSIKNTSLTRISASEKVPQPSTSLNICDAPVADSNNHKIIVKISNRSRSPAQNVNGGPLEDRLLMNSRASSPAVPEMSVQSECSSKDKIDGYQNSVMNTESWQSNDLKDGVVVCDEGDGSPAAALDSGCSGDTVSLVDELEKAVAKCKSALIPGELLDYSINSLNALLESCDKYSEANVPMSAGDVVGMNLLASVAAGEMTKSSVASPALSPQRSTSVAEGSCMDNNVISEPNGDAYVALVGESYQSKSADDVEGQNKNIPSGASAVQTEEQHDLRKTLENDLMPNGDPCLRSGGELDESGPPPSVSPPICTAGSGIADQGCESMAAVVDNTHVSTPHSSQGVASCMTTEVKNGDVSLKEDNQLRHVEADSVPSADVDEKNDYKMRPESKAVVEKLPPAAKATKSLRRIEKATVSSCINSLLPGQFNDLIEDDVDVGVGRLHNEGAKQNMKLGKDPLKKHGEFTWKSGAFNQDTKSNEVTPSDGETPVCSASQISSRSPAHEEELLSDTKDSTLPAQGGENVEEERPCDVNAASPAVGSSGTEGKLEFDLNEGFDMDDSKDEDLTSTSPGCLSSVLLSGHVPTLSVASTSASIPTSVTVAAAAKGPFVPPEDLLRNKGELRWKGSAATSAFRPAEPRKVLEMPSGPNNSRNCNVDSGKQSRVRLEIDLNVADESSMEDMECQINDLQASKREGFGTNIRQTGATSGCNSGSLDLDLNRVNEVLNTGQLPSVGHRFGLPLQPVRWPSPNTLLNSDSGRRDFDLNNGPGTDEASVDSLSLNQHIRANIPFQPSVGFRINSSEVGLNPWYLAGSTFSPIPVPAPLLDREQPFPISGTGGCPPRMLGGPSGAIPFSPDMYRGSVLSSSPAAPFPGAPFQYPVFPFGNSFPLPSSSLQAGSTAFMDPLSGGRLSIPAVTSQPVGSGPYVLSQYPRPYAANLSDAGNSFAVDNARNWGRQGLDLNAGPGGPDSEGRDGSLPIPPRSLSTLGSLGLTDDQLRMYAMAGGIVKRKEPEGGWDSDRRNHKQPSLQ